MRRVICDYCGKNANLVTGKEMYPHRPDLFDLKIWQCKPCGASVGTHKNSDAVPLGRLANAKLKKAKQRAHAVFDPIWKGREMKRGKAYAWLADRLGIPLEKCHIGMFDEEMCERVIDACENRLVVQ